MSFKDILSKPIEEIKAKPPIPKGTYDWLIRKHTFSQSAKQKTDQVTFDLKATSVGEDVDQDALNTLGGLSAVESSITFYLTEDAAYRLREFAENDCKVFGANLEAIIPALTNATFRGYVDHRPSEDGKKVYSEIKKTLPIT